MTARSDRALIVLKSLASGKIDTSDFTQDATWWSVTGQSFPLAEFIEILASLHSKTIGGIVIDTGLVICDGDHVVIEATSNVPLLNGGRYANRYLFLIHFRDDLVREVKEYNDSAHVSEAFGI